MRLTLATVVAAALLCSAPNIVLAEDTDDAEVTRMAKEHYKLGLDAYKAGKYDAAIKELKKAYLLKRLPPLLINIGATYRKMGSLDLSLQFYKRYLDEAPADAKDRSDVERTIAEVEQQKAGGGAPADDAGDDNSKSVKREAQREKSQGQKAPRDFSHSIVDAAPPDQPIDIRVSMPVMKGVKVFTYYRAPGEADFTSLLMKRHGQDKVARIPASAAAGKSVQYYIEARDAANTVVRSSGSQASPNIVMIDANAKPQTIASLEPGKGAHDDDRSGKAMRDLDDEAAPVSGKLTDEKPERHRSSSSDDASGKKGLGTMAWAGIAIGAAGVLAAAGSIIPFYLASRDANAITADSRSIDKNTGMPYRFNDPNAPGADDKSFEAHGRLMNNLGIGLAIGGAALAVGGTALAIYGITSASKSEKPKRPSADLSRWYVAPAVGPRFVGAGGGLSF